MLLLGLLAGERTVFTEGLYRTSEDEKKPGAGKGTVRAPAR